MDRDRLRREAALRARANAAMMAALAAADACAPSPDSVLSDSMGVIKLVCWDSILDPGERLALVDEALLLMAPLKELTGAPQAARPALIVEILRRTNNMLRRYAQFVRADHAAS